MFNPSFVFGIFLFIRSSWRRFSKNSKIP
jgi:hypothetical protein